MPSSKKEFGKRTSERRKKRGLMQSELAELLGVDRSSISTYEIGRAMPSAAMLNRLADALHTSVDYLLGNTDNPAPNDPEAEFAKQLSLTDDEILKLFTLEVDGQPLTDDEFRDVLAYIRVKRQMKDL